MQGRGVTLAKLQADFQACVLGKPGEHLRLTRHLDAGFGLPPERRAAIYHHAYRARLREALGSVFERTWAYVGDDEFAAATGRYIEAHPPASRNLGDYGADFPASLRQALPADPEVAELATMDWNLHVAFGAPDIPPLDVAALARLGEDDWSRAGFAFHPGMSLAVFEWNAPKVWHAIDQGETPPPASRLERPVAHLFWRSALASRFRSLDDAEFDALRELREGATFADVCGRSTPEQAGAWLQTWIRDELLVGVSP